MKTCEKCNKTYNNYEDMMYIISYGKCIDCRESEQLGIPEVVRQYIIGELLSEYAIKLAMSGMFEDYIVSLTEKTAMKYHLDYDIVKRFINNQVK